MTMDFAYGESFLESSPEAYERLILDVLIGEAPLFPRHEEVELSWKILDPVEEFWATQAQPEAYPAGTWGPAGADEMMARRRPRLAAAMIQDLTDTVASKVAAAFVEARHRAGIPAIGMVGDAGHRHRRGGTTTTRLRAAQESRPRAPGAHPRRRSAARAAGKPRLDAEVRFLGDSGPGETVVLRLHGELADHAESVLLPLLLPDAPVIVWWPGEAPAVPAEDPVGHLAQRRITDAAAAADPAAALGACARRATSPGDTDLAWTRITSWRTVLAAALDQPYDPIIGGRGRLRAGQPERRAAGALARDSRSACPVEQEDSDGPGITEVRADDARPATSC